MCIKTFQTFFFFHSTFTEIHVHCLRTEMDLDGINFSYGDKVHESGVHSIIAVSPSPTSGLDGHETRKFERLSKNC